MKSPKKAAARRVESAGRKNEGAETDPGKDRLRNGDSTTEAGVLEVLDPTEQEEEAEALDEFISPWALPKFDPLIAERIKAQRLADQQRRDAARLEQQREFDKLRAETELAERVASGKLAFRTADEVIDEEPPAEVVEDLLVEGGVTVLVGDPNAGKTFTALSVAAALSEGRPLWASETAREPGLVVQRGSTVYVNFEGALGPRLRALREARHDLSGVHLVNGRDVLSPRVDVRTAAETASTGEANLTEALGVLARDLAVHGKPPVRLLVVDTLRASLSGSEDSSENISAYLRAIRRLLDALPGAGALILHHTGWSDQKQKSKPARERGSSALRGNVDATYVLETDGEPENGEQRLTLRCLKLRDGERPPPRRLVRRTVRLEGGTKIKGSCVVEADPRPAAKVHQQQDAARSARDGELNLAVLRTVRDITPSSRRAIRSMLHASREDAEAATDRMLHHGMIRPPERQREPFELTEAGWLLLDSASDPGPPDLFQTPQTPVPQGLSGQSGRPARVILSDPEAKRAPKARRGASDPEGRKRRKHPSHKGREAVRRVILSDPVK